MQKTAYETRISNWSSDVCSSDLTPVHSSPARSCWRRKAAGSFENIPKWSLVAILEASDVGGLVVDVPDVQQHRATVDGEFRSEERRVGKECVSTCRSRWSPYHYKKKMRNHRWSLCYTSNSNINYI